MKQLQVSEAGEPGKIPKINIPIGSNETNSTSKFGPWMIAQMRENPKQFKNNLKPQLKSLSSGSRYDTFAVEDCLNDIENENIVLDAGNFPLMPSNDAVKAKGKGKTTALSDILNKQRAKQPMNPAANPSSMPTPQVKPMSTKTPNMHTYQAKTHTTMKSNSSKSASQTPHNAANNRSKQSIVTLGDYINLEQRHATQESIVKLPTTLNPANHSVVGKPLKQANPKPSLATTSASNVASHTMLNFDTASDLIGVTYAYAR